MPRPLLLLLGDSLTEFGAQVENDGWVALLTQRLARSADVASRGLGGYNTQMFLDVVLTALVVDLAISLHPQLITLWLGANDAALPDGSAAAQHVPLLQYQRNLHKMLETLQTHAPQSELLLITPLPIDDDVRRRYAGSGPVDRTNAMARAYAKACVEVGKEARVHVLDLYTLFTQHPEQQWKALLSDGLHLSRRGNRVVEYLLANTIKTDFSELQQRLDQWEFPPFDQLLDPHHDSCPVPTISRFSFAVSLLRRSTLSLLRRIGWR